MDKRRRTDNTSKEEGQITHQKKKDKRTDHDLQNTTRKTKDRATRSPQKIGGDIRWSKRVSSSCSISAMYMVFQKIILKVLVLDYINVPVLSTGAINAIIWSPSRIISYQF